MVILGEGAVSHARGTPLLLLLLVFGIGVRGPRKVDVRLPGKGNANSHGARPVYKNHLDH
jgi:hypothetical protein